MSARRPLRNLLALAASAWAAVSALAGERPNFVVVLGEGHGWSSTSVQMDDAVPESKSRILRTPHLETLARSGMRFASFYAASPRCTPSRAALLTGKSPAQLHMTFVNEGRRETEAGTGRRIATPAPLTELPAAETTMAELLKRAGYATAHFGKWHLGRVDPKEHGFDESDGPTNNGGPDDVENPHPKELLGMTERGLAFMERQVTAGRPFCLQLSHYASRRGGEATPEAVARVKSWGLKLDGRELTEAAADVDLDLALGRLLAKIQELGLASNTYVLFTTDHGTPGRNPPLTGGKGTVSEGGLRVPLIVSGPGIAGGSCTHVRAFHEDLLPTLAALAHVDAPLPEGVEGGDLADVLHQGDAGKVVRARESFVVHFPHYDKDPAGPASAIYLGHLKLVRLYASGERRLFDLAEDPAERRDLAGARPEKVRELDGLLSEYLSAVHAQMPGSSHEDASGKHP